jgi:hypothetical protein
MSSVKLQCLFFCPCLLLQSYNKSNAVGTITPDHAIIPYSGSRRTFAFILYLSPSGQHYTPVALSSGTNSGTHWKGDWVGPEPFRIFGGGINSFPLLRLEPRIARAVVQSKSRLLYKTGNRESPHFSNLFYVKCKYVVMFHHSMCGATAPFGP